MKVWTSLREYIIYSLIIQTTPNLPFISMSISIVSFNSMQRCCDMSTACGEMNVKVERFRE